MKSRNMLFAFAALMGIIAIVLFFVVAQPASAKEAEAVITQKVFKPAGEYVQYPVGARDSFYSPSKIPIAECYIFTLRVPGLDKDARIAINTIAAQQFEVGQHVHVTYETRGIPLLGRRVFLTQMKP